MAYGKGFNGPVGPARVLHRARESLASVHICNVHIRVFLYCTSCAPRMIKVCLVSMRMSRLHARVHASFVLEDDPPRHIAHAQVRATHGVHKGAWYFEVVIEHVGSTGHVRLGWSTRKAELQARVF